MPPSTKTPSSPRAQPTGRKVGVRQQAAQDARETILRAATRIFAKHGFAGGRVDQISKASKSYDRMIYYYFGSKEKLFIAVLEEMYRRFNIAESSLQWDEAQPQQALAAVTTFIWNYYQRNPEFITLLNDENLHRGKHIAKSLRAQEYSSPAIQILEKILASGVNKQIFRADITGRDVYLTIASLNYFYLSNRHTLSAFLGEKMESAQLMDHWHQYVQDAILRIVKA